MGGSSSSSSSSSSSGEVKVEPVSYRKLGGTGIEAPISNCDSFAAAPESILSQSQIKYALGDIFAPLQINNLDDLISELPETSRTSDLSELLVSGMFKVADSISQTLAQNFGQLNLSCDANTSNGRACASAFLAKHGSRAVGRKMASQEIEEMLTDLFDSENDFDKGMKQVLSALLLKADFLYISEQGVEVGDGSIALSSLDKAKKLAALLWNSIPDDNLINAAANNELDSESGFKQQVDRMLADEKFARGLTQFHKNWIHLHDYSGSVGSGMTEQSMLVQAAFANNESLPDLFLTTRGFVNGELAEIYGVPKAQAANVFEEVYLPSRPGILTRVPILVGTSEGLTSPTRRGEIISSQVLCDIVLSAPPEIQDLFPTLPEANGRSTRQVVEETTAAAASCINCHSLTDPFGFALEHFGGDGKYRAQEPGNIDIDAFIGESRLGSLNGAGGLAEAVASSPKIYACYAGKWFHYAFLRDKKENACVADDLSKRFEESGGDLVGLIHMLVNNPAMHYRKIK